MPLSPVRLEQTHPPLLSTSSHHARIQSSSVLTSDELNFLVYRYLLESGFVHSAFVFATEGYIGKSGLEGTAQVPPGALVQFVQKGLQYLEIESHINDDGTETQCEESFSVIQPHVCQTNGRKRIFDPYEPISADYGVLEIDLDETAVLRGHEELATAVLWNPRTDVIASVSSDGTCCVWDLSELALDDKRQSRDRDGSVIVEALHVLKTARAEAAKVGAEGVKVGKATAATSSSDEETEDDDVTAKKKGGKAKKDKAKEKDAKDAKSSGAVPKPEPDVGKSVLTLDWSEDGGLVSVGCYDGSVHVWSAEGKVVGSKTEHAAPVSVVKWARTGLVFLSGSMDHTVLLWTEACVVTARYTTHTGPVLDVDWRDGTTLC
jgi:transducin (beta)-like 1